MFFGCIFVYLLFRDINAEIPLSSCPFDYPFSLRDSSCGSFEEICFKHNDKQCKQLQNACKQCPPNNITLIILENLHSRITKLESISKEMQSTIIKVTNSIETHNKEIIENMKGMYSFLTILFVFVILLFIETRFKFFTKLVQLFSRAKSFDHFPEESHYSLIQSRKTKYYNDMESRYLSSLENRFQTNTSSSSNNNIFTSIYFQFDDIGLKPIELYVQNDHNIVQVKQQICAKLPHAEHDDYKIMKLKYNGIILNDDNQYLLENIDKSNAIVNCFIDSSMNASDIVVVKLQGKMRLPDIIQINKNQTIDQLKELIGKIIKTKDFLLFKQSNKLIKIEKLTDNLKDFIDNDLIIVATKETGKLIIRSIFDDEDSITIEYVNVDLVSSLMRSISNKFTWDLNNFLLFYNNKCLEADKYIFDYQISSKSAVKYCCFMKWAGIDMDSKLITKGNFSEIRCGTLKNTNRKILIKKYEVISSINWKDEEFMLKELITFQITKSHRRFIQLLGVYIDDTILYVVMENMDGGTLKTFLQDNYDKLDKNKIYKWSAQILEGLKFLHENKVIHRDLNPSSILVDGNEDLKLSSFNLSKYLDIYKPSSIMITADKVKKFRLSSTVLETLAPNMEELHSEYMKLSNENDMEELPLRYMAPEILNSQIYGEACDVWSFGAVLIRIITNKKPFPNITKTKKDLIENAKLENVAYKLPDKYSEFKSIIDSCLIIDPIKRKAIKELLTNKNFKNYVSF